MMTIFPKATELSLQRFPALLVLLLTTCLPLHSFAQAQWQDVERIVVVGDIHGDYDNYRTVLRQAGLINRRGNWIAGNTHFVQMGDLPDRGPDTDQIIEHMQRLETQARRRGGMVHALIGNHEAMVMTGDLRYVHPGEYEALRSRRARQLQDDYYAQFVALWQSQEEPPVIDENTREEWNLQYPLGYVEHRLHWSPEGEFGKWVLDHNAIIKINNILFVHGGIGPEFLGMSMDEINRQVRAELQDYNNFETPLIDAAQGPLWYRGLAMHDEASEALHLQALLDFYQVEHIVVGHTPGYNTIVPRFDSTVLVVDSGISSYYGGHLASLLIEEGQMTNVQRGESFTIPATSEGLPDYYRQILELEPDAANLRQLLHNLEHPEEASQPAIDEDLL